VNNRCQAPVIHPFAALSLVPLEGWVADLASTALGRYTT
jgi:hypothetical protein